MFWLPCSQASYFFHKAHIVIYTAVTYIYNRLWPALLGHMLCKLRNYRKLVKAESSASKEIALGTGASYSMCVYDCSAWGSLSCTRKNQFDHRQLSSRVFCKEKHSKHALSNTTQPLSTTPWAFKEPKRELKYMNQQWGEQLTNMTPHRRCVSRKRVLPAEEWLQGTVW